MLSKDHKPFRQLGISLLCLTAILIAPALYAGDEDISPNAYNVFDPVTGYMITVESQPDAQQDKSMTAIDPNAEAEQADEEDEDFTVPQRWIFLLAVIFLAVGYAVWKRNKENISSM
jgi:hypothetical protein